MISNLDPGAGRDHAEPSADAILAGASGEFARLLAAASAPAHAHELAGEEAAMNAFRAHHAGAARQPRGSSPALRFGPAMLFRVKLAVGAALAVAATGGVALAATTGALPGPLGDITHHDTRPTRPTSVRPPATGGGATPTGAALPPSPSPRDLCRAYAATPRGDRDGALDSPPFHLLVVAAGGMNGVSAYCDALLPAPETPGQHSSLAGTPAHPTGKPHPVPKTAHPTPAHVTPAHPTGRPGDPAEKPGERLGRLDLATTDPTGTNRPD